MDSADAGLSVSSDWRRFVTEQSRRCSKCAAEVVSGDRFCSSCGTVLSEEPTSAPTATPGELEGDDGGQSEDRANASGVRGAKYRAKGDPQHPRRRKRILVLVGLVAVMVSASGFFIWRWNADTSPPTADQSVTGFVAADIGGKVSLGDEASLIIPPGALSNDATITIFRVDDTDSSPSDDGLIVGAGAT